MVIPIQCLTKVISQENAEKPPYGGRPEPRYILCIWL